MAEELFNEGVALADNGHYADACELLGRALEEATEASASELDPALVDYYYRYGDALVSKIADQADVFASAVDQIKEKKEAAAAAAKQPQPAAAADDDDDDVDPDIAAADAPPQAPAGDAELAATLAAEEQQAAEQAPAENGGEEEVEGDFQIAWEVLEVARVLAEKKGDKRMEILALRRLADLSTEQDNPDQAVADFGKCIEACADLDDPRLVADLNFSVALVHEMNKQFPEALKHVTEAIRIFDDLASKASKAGEDATTLTEIAGELKQKAVDIKQAMEKPPEIQAMMMAAMQNAGGPMEGFAPPQLGAGPGAPSQAGAGAVDLGVLGKRKAEDAPQPARPAPAAVAVAPKRKEPDAPAAPHPALKQQALMDKMVAGPGAPVGTTTIGF